MARRSGPTALDDSPRADAEPRSRRARKARRAANAVEEPEPREPRTRRERRARKARRAANAVEEPEPREPRTRRERAPQSRRERRLRERRRRHWKIVMPALAILVVITVIVGRGLRSELAHRAPAAAGSAARQGATTKATPPSTLLLVHRGANGQADLITVVGVSSPKKGGPAASILLIPSATQVETPSLGIQTLADLPNVADPKVLITTVENLLGIALMQSMVIDDAGLSAALAPAAPLSVRLRAPVRISASDSETAIPAGDQTLAAADAARILAAHEPGSELEHLVTVQAVLEGWLSRLRDHSIASATEVGRPALAVLAVAAQARVRVDSLPVDTFTTGGGERFQPRRDDIAQYVRTAFRAALLAPGGKRPRVEILNGTGMVGLAQSIASIVVPAGGDVRLTGNVPGFGVPTTQVVYYRDQDRPAAEHLLAALKCGGLKRANTALDFVDVTILVGADCQPSS